jgi:putative addiction module killer protein
LAYEVAQTPAFRLWYQNLRDRSARLRISARIERLQLGHFGQCRSLGQGLHELKVDHGPGYRIYFVNRSGKLVLLLCGGDKSSQSRDIERARLMAESL